MEPQEQCGNPAYPLGVSSPGFNWLLRFVLDDDIAVFPERCPGRFVLHSGLHFVVQLVVAVTAQQPHVVRIEGNVWIINIGLVQGYLMMEQEPSLAT